MKASSSTSPTTEGVIGIEPLRLLDHGRAEIDADAVRRLELRQQVAGAAAEIEHARALRDQELHVVAVVAIEGAVARDPLLAFGRDLVGVIQNRGLARIGARRGSAGDKRYVHDWRGLSSWAARGGGAGPSAPPRRSQGRRPTSAARRRSTARRRRRARHRPARTGPRSAPRAGPSRRSKSAPTNKR